MKRLTFFGFLIGLVFSSISTIQAQDANTTNLCNMTPPVSCFSAVVTANGNAETKKRDNTPTDCPQGEWDLTGLNTSILQPVCENLNVGGSGSCNTKNDLKTLQTKLKTACGGNTCKPENIKDPLNELEITCFENYFDDGKYGLCTEEAVRRYLEWYKVENCNIAPTLTITAPTETIVGEEINAKITASGGKIYEWDDENAFITKPVNENPVLENITLSSSNSNISFTPPDSTVVGDNTIIFSNTGTTNLSATGNVKEKLNLKSPSNETQITIISSPNQEKPNNELGCNQLLPKYLVGASCNTELKGDARDITYWLQKFSGQITTFIAAIAVLLIAWNAFGLVMASGDSDQIANGKKALMWVGIGLLLTVFAYVIVKTALSLTFLQ